MLNWPPSRGTIAVFLVVSVASLGTIVVLGGVTDTQPEKNITVSATELSVELNDEVEYPDTNGTVETCLGSGTPGDHLGVLGDITVTIPADRAVTPREVIVRLDDRWNRTVETIEDSGEVTTDVFWVFADDETLSVGDTTTVEISVREQDSTVATASRTVSVENGSRSYDC